LLFQEPMNVRNFDKVFNVMLMIVIDGLILIDFCMALIFLRMINEKEKSSVTSDRAQCINVAREKQFLLIHNRDDLKD
jgi:hypothetical protein